MPIYEVVVDGKSFRVEVEEISQNKYRVRVNGKEGVMEVSEKAKKIWTEKKVETQTSTIRGGEIKAEMSGSVVRVLVKKGDRVKSGQAVLILEAMKMENEISSPSDGIVEDVLVGEGDKVQAGDVLVVISSETTAEKGDEDSLNTENQDGSIVRAEMAGTVVRILKKEGQDVRSGEAVLILEAMKMENEISSPSDGKIARVFVGEGMRVQIGDPLFSLS